MNIMHLKSSQNDIYHLAEPGQLPCRYWQLWLSNKPPTRRTNLLTVITACKHWQKTDI